MNSLDHLTDYQLARFNTLVETISEKLALDRAGVETALTLVVCRRLLRIDFVDELRETYPDAVPSMFSLFGQWHTGHPKGDQYTRGIRYYDYSVADTMTEDLIDFQLKLLTAYVRRWTLDKQMAFSIQGRCIYSLPVGAAFYTQYEDSRELRHKKKQLERFVRRTGEGKQL